MSDLPALLELFLMVDPIYLLLNLIGLIQLLGNKFVDNLRHSVQLLHYYSLKVILSLLQLPHFGMNCHRVSSQSVNANGSPGTLI